MSRTDKLAAAEDPRFPPTGCFVAFGAAVTVGIGLSLVHKALIAIVPLGMLTVELVRRRRGYAVRDRQHLIVMNAPLPGTTAPTMVSTLIVFGAMLTAFHAGDPVPAWAVLTAGTVAGVACALLWRRSELHHLAGIRRLERAAESDAVS